MLRVRLLAAATALLLGAALASRAEAASGCVDAADVRPRNTTRREAAAATENCSGGAPDPAGGLAIGPAATLCIVGSSACQAAARKSHYARRIRDHEALL